MLVANIFPNISNYLLLYLRKFSPYRGQTVSVGKLRIKALQFIPLELKCDICAKISAVI